jgi:hypothetical protein
MTNDDWEVIGRKSAHCMLWSLADDAEATIDLVASPVLWGHDVSAEDVERMRAFVFKARYVTEAYLARLCDETEPWSAGFTPEQDRPEPLPDALADRTRGDADDGQ